MCKFVRNRTKQVFFVICQTVQDAFEEGGVLHGKKVYLFSCTEPQLLFFNGQSKVTCTPVVVALKDSNLKYINLCPKKVSILIEVLSSCLFTWFLGGGLI
ncbi:putative protein HEAT INTOLERANT 4 [Helianthus anomalus]